MPMKKTLKNDISRKIVHPSDSSLQPVYVTSGTIFTLSLMEKIFK